MPKKFLPYIGKLTKAVVIATFTTVFFISGLMLCCEIGLLPSKGHKANESSCCASKHSNQIKNEHPDTCLCCQLTKSQPDRIHESFALTQNSHHEQYINASDLDPFQMRQQFAVSLSSQGPPRAPTIPIYLQLSVLRL